ncbi:PQ-loop repeat-containing protein 1 [Caenorhabditis elegans]|uniref:PQ-loop repeat-containing protein 1 n=1 Tax=Caenorhabditis elegans TaxID=6239 RepID=G5EE99_CAEEL|nr:PQ-loop repeat-containing protein 1 [Caenorhabditis elegans]CAD56601.2 PQ-loop repeat-containing protein 1 [Caenorhabditis elegans]|eukprot:NP_871866.2 Uncharacterized protein CELE_T19A6.1 [Caenorhabditis elegans]
MTETMIVVEPRGLGLVPWEKVSTWLIMGITKFFQFFIIVGGSIPYVFQYVEIHHRRNASGFSLFVCLALCVANILRILFWFGKWFDNALLAQSIVMLICMILMLELAVRMNRKHTPKPLRKSILKQTYHRNTVANLYYVIINGKWDHFKEGDFIRSFWAWHDLASFIIALLVFTIFWSGIMSIIIHFQISILIETIGMIALLTEATLGVPQLLRNFQRKSTQGMSIPMVLAWLAGDLAKTGYFVATGSPKQFWVCAILQITIDILILGQVFIYRKNTNAGELPYTANNPAIQTHEAAID